MAAVIPFDEIKSRPTAVCFPGGEHGDPGGGPSLHTRDEIDTTWLEA